MWQVEQQPLNIDLRTFVSEKKLKQNTNNFPEFSQQLTTEDRRKLRKIVRNLKRLPLVHCTRNGDFVQPIPAANNPDLARNTYPLDRSLGLDKYVFMNWGYGDWSQYGSRLFCYPSKLLFNKDTVVTQTDVLNIAIGEEKKTFDILSFNDKEQIQKRYFDKMLTGKDWFRLISLRVLNLLNDKDEEYKCIPIDAKTFGEIKILGPVTTPYTAAYVGRTEMETKFYPEQMYPNGFIFENAFHNLYWGTTGVDPLPTEKQQRQMENAWK